MIIYHIVITVTLSIVTSSTAGDLPSKLKGLTSSLRIYKRLIHCFSLSCTTIGMGNMAWHNEAAGVRNALVELLVERPPVIVGFRLLH